MKIVLVGADGMLGHAIAERFAGHELYKLNKDDLDITDEHAVLRLLPSYTPDIIINTAAYTDVDGAESHKEEAMRVNGDGVGYLATAAQNCGAVLMHFSTDYIFNGALHEGYDEHTNEFEPLNVYGESKLLGEQLLQENCSRYYIVRTSWLFGPHGKNFVTTMLQLAREHASLKVVDDQHGRPTYTRDLADAVYQLVEDRSDYGVYHLTNAVNTAGHQHDSITWYAFAHELFEEAEMDVTITPCTSAEFPRPAVRPQFSILLNTKRPQLRDWRLALQEYVATL